MPVYGLNAIDDQCMRILNLEPGFGGDQPCVFSWCFRPRVNEIIRYTLGFKNSKSLMFLDSDFPSCIPIDSSNRFPRPRPSNKTPVFPEQDELDETLYMRLKFYICGLQLTSNTIAADDVWILTCACMCVCVYVCIRYKRLKRTVEMSKKNHVLKKQKKHHRYHPIT